MGLVVGNSLSISLSDLKSENELIEEFKSNSYPVDESNSRHVDIPVLFVRLFNEIRREIEAKRISFPIQTRFKAEGVKVYKKGAVGTGVDSNISGQILRILFDKYNNKSFVPRALELADSSNDFRIIETKVIGSSTEVLLRISFSKNDPEQYAKLLNKKFSAKKDFSSGILRLAYRNTIASVENNQVQVITRLPRASIDSFLKSE